MAAFFGNFTTNEFVTMLLSVAALGFSLYTFYKTVVFEKYQEADQIYMRILEIGIEHPSFRDKSKTKNYEKHFSHDERIQYENYAYIVWNFLETLYDRKSIKDKTYEGLLRDENDLHSEWFKRNSENLFKESFIKYIYEKFG